MRQKPRNSPKGGLNKTARHHQSSQAKDLKHSDLQSFQSVGEGYQEEQKFIKEPNEDINTSQERHQGWFEESLQVDKFPIHKYDLESNSLKESDLFNKQETSESNYQQKMKKGDDSIQKQQNQCILRTDQIWSQSQNKNMNHNKEKKNRESNKSKYTNFITQLMKRIRQKLKAEQHLISIKEDYLKKVIFTKKITTQKQLFNHLLYLFSGSSRSIWKIYSKKLMKQLQEIKVQEEDHILEGKCSRIQMDLNLISNNKIEKAFSDRFKKKKEREWSLYQARQRKNVPKIKKNKLIAK